MKIIAKLNDQEITLANTGIPSKDDVIKLEDEFSNTLAKVVKSNWKYKKCDNYKDVFVLEEVLLILEEL